MRSSLVLAVLLACGGGAKHPHDHGGGMPHRFDDAAHWAKVFDDPARDRWQEPDRVIAALALTTEMTVADVGAGTGYFAVRLAPLVKEVIATDIETTLVDHIAQRAAHAGITNLRAQLTPPDDPQLAGIDRILVVDVWHHLGDRRAYARKLAAALTAGGFVAVVDFKLDAKLGPPAKHRLAPAAIIADLAAAGLDASVALELPEQYVVIARKR